MITLVKNSIKEATMPKYRLKPVFSHTWIIQKRFCFFFWKNVLRRKSDGSLGPVYTASLQEGENIIAYWKSQKMEAKKTRRTPVMV
jgi:hypothetical protein